jgi:tetratricopeptide (TPR) repeat protein
MRNAVLRFPGLLACALAAVLAGPARAAEDPAALGTRLLEKRHYAEAIAVMRPVAARPGAGGKALLALGVAYVRNAELHRALHRTAAAVRLDYLKRLSAERGTGGSAVTALALGETFLAAGKLREAKTQLERYLAKAGKKSPDGAVAAIDLALCRHRMGETREAKALLAGVDAADPDVKAESVAARARLGAPDAKAAAAASEALAAGKRPGGKPSARALKNVALAYARAGQAEKAIDLVARADLAAFSREETLGRHKTVRFYDPFLLDDLATIYLAAGIAALESAAADPAVRDAAGYSLGEAYALAGSADASAKALDAVAASARMSAGYKDRAAARQAGNRYAAGRKSEALRAWEDLSRKGPADPELLAEVVAACDRAGAPCDGVVGRAAAAAEAGEGKRFRALRFALGRHFLARGQNGAALAHLEAARDKGNKNRIEANDPGLLADLAEGYYRTRKYSEAQEIHFELGKQFPAVRQIQDALQGIYAREQKSPGDVRIL